jgi:hypothetical protein
MGISDKKGGGGVPAGRRGGVEVPGTGSRGLVGIRISDEQGRKSDDEESRS